MEPVDVTEAARIQAKADAKSSRVADLVAKKVAAVDCEDFEEAARLKEELNAARLRKAPRPSNSSARALSATGPAPASAEG